MARAYPDWTVGEGDVIGLQGASSEWPYNVDIDDPADDPIVPLMVVAAPNSPHPDPRMRGLTVSGYRKRKRLNDLWWKVIVIYAPLSDQTLGLWRRTVHYANETRPLDVSLANINEDTGQVVDAPLWVGDVKYEIANTTDPAYGATPYRLGIDGATRLIAKDAIDPSRGGIDVNDGIMALSYEITVPQLTVQQLITLMSYRWNTNSREWMAIKGRGTGYEKWSVIFSNFAVEDRIVNLQDVGGYWFSVVSLEVLYRPIHDKLNPYGWRAVQRPDSYSDDSHHRWAVYRLVDGQQQLVVRNYIVYEEMDFNAPFRVCGSVPSI